MSKVILVAGGTAGHINAALSLGEYFSNKNWRLNYLSGTRYLDKKLFPHEQTLFLETRALRTKNPILLLKNIFLNIITFMKMLAFFVKQKPDLIIGAGGYVCGPTLLAGYVLRKPVFIIEQNAITGLTNKILQHISSKVFTHFQNTKGISNDKVIVSGNPVRSQIKTPSKRPINTKINILVFGGSLGALQINQAIKHLLSLENLLNLEIVHQVGSGNKFQSEKTNQNIKYVQLEYIDDMAYYYDWADIIISRAGASTIAELRIVQKPCILIPYPAATDNHQYYNALQLKNENIFAVEIVDLSLRDENLAKEILKGIEKIKENKTINKHESFQNNSCEIIYNEVVKYVRNK